MQRTILNTPIIAPIARWISLGIIKLTGWKMVGQPPQVAHCVVVGAPHTTNWDVFYAVVFSFAFGLELLWMGKHTLFRWPMGYFMRWMGGIPVDRRTSHNAVDQMSKLFKSSERLHLVVAPEGTRSKTDRWKTGFYYIAAAAGVPISLGFLDYGRRRAGFGPTIIPSGDLAADLAVMQEFYSDITGMKPDQSNAPTFS